MTLGRIIVILCFLVLLGVPLLVSPDEEAGAGDVERTLIIISPHNEQIRYEFGRGFEQWHLQKFGEAVKVIWNRPGGTSEIRRMLEAQYRSALRDNRPVGGSADMVMGGGSYEFSRLAREITEDVNGETRTSTILAPVDFDQQWLDDIYGQNRIVNGYLYDPDKYWFGAALSGFGIVYNRDMLREIDVDDPVVWSDLCDPKFRGWIALANPAQSGSITTAFEIILQRLEWAEGWAVLRRAGANARYFSASSIKPPLDVSQGDAAAAVCIDFYGRYQSQAVKDAGGGDRIGYIDPPGLTTIDPDPVAMLRGARDPELARRFIEFSLSVKGQALWQYPSVSRGGASEKQLGPEKFELRRLPIARVMYQPPYYENLIDQVNPYEIGTPIENPNSNYRDFVAMLFSAMAMDSHDELHQAWNAIVEHPAYPRESADKVITADEVEDATLKRMLELFDDLPSVSGPNGAVYDLDDVESLKTVRDGWLRGGWKDENLWPAAARPIEVLRRQCGEHFRANYRAIVEMSD